ncbi:MAG: peptidoglycan-binding domain-containing protein [Patescibacteria group bacterium]
MSKFNKTGRKALSVFMSVATVTWLVGAPLAASAALTQSNIDSIIGLLQSFGADTATINNVRTSLTGGAPSGGTGSGTSTGSCGFTRDLSVAGAGGSSTGEDVRCLQKYLNGAGHQIAATGAGSPGSESTNFGPLTKAAVMKWQTSAGITPVAGYFGLKSRNAYNAMAGGTTPPPSGTPPPAGTGTGLSVSAGTQPQATLAVQSAINVPFTRVRFTASSDGDVVVNSLTVERTGLMNDAVFSGIILLDEQGVRLGLSKTLNSNHQTILTEPFTVKAGQTREMTIAGDMVASLSSYAGQAGTLSLAAVNTSAVVNGSLPLTGTTQTINSSLTVGSATLDNGSIEPGSSPTKEVGTTGYTFSSIKVTAGSAEDMELRSMRFNQSGSASKEDLANVVMVDKDGKTYTPIVSSDGKYYTGVFNPPLQIKKGEQTEISLKGDIVSGSNRTIKFDLYRYSDVVVRGKTFGYDVQPTSADDGDTSQTDADGSFDDDLNPIYDAYKVTVGNGSLSVSADNSVVPAQNVVSGGSQVPLGGFKLEVKGEPVTFTSWAISITTTDNDSGGENGTITSVTVYDKNGAAVAGPKDFSGGVAGSAAPFTMTFTDSITVPVGVNTYTIKGTLNTAWESNDTIALSFTPSTGITSITGQTTGNSITATPAVSVTGATITVKAGTLVVTPSTSLSSQNVIAPSTSVELGRFSLDATASGDDLRVTSAAFRKTVVGATGSAYTGLKLWDGTTQLNTGTNVVDATGNTENLTFTLDNNLIITKGSSKTLTLTGNISSTATGGGTIKFDFSAGSPDWSVTTKAQSSTVSETLTSSVNGATMTIRGAGGYSVALDASAPTEIWTPAGSTGVTLNVLRFTATSEELAVTDLRLQIDATGSSTGANFAAIELWDGATLVQRKVSPSFTDGVEDFQFPQSGIGSFLIPKDSFKRLTVKVDLAGICSSCPGQAGAYVGIDYDAAGANATSGKQKAVGKQSGSSVHASNSYGSDTAGQGVVTFLSVPTVAKINLSSSKLVSGTQDLFMWSVKADLKYDIAINRLSFKIATSGVTTLRTTLPGFQVYVSPNPDMSNAKIMNTATGSAAAFFDQTQNFDASHNLVLRILADNTSDYSNSWVTIPAGSTYYFTLKGAVTTDGTGDSIATTLLGDSARAQNVDLIGSDQRLLGTVSSIDLEQGQWYGKAGNAASTTAFIWADFSSDAASSSASHSTTSHDWMNGFKVPGLPTTGLNQSVLAN